MSDPVTNHVRPIKDLLQQAAALCESLTLVTRIFQGTVYDDLAAECASILTESGGEPAAVIAYGGSDFGDHPRRVSEIDIIVLAARTRVNTPAFDILEKTQDITAALDDTITQETEDGWPITDRWKLSSEQSMNLKGAKAAAAVILSFDVEDY